MRIPGRRPSENRVFSLILQMPIMTLDPPLRRVHIFQTRILVAPERRFRRPKPQKVEAKNPVFRGPWGGQKGPKKGGGKFGTCTTPHPPHPWGGQGRVKIHLFFVRISVSANYDNQKC